MDREIIFKAKALDGGKWVYGYFYEECGNTYIIDNRQKKSELNRNHPVKVDPATVCQYTGIRDSNGKRIYFDDVLEASEDRSDIRLPQFKVCCDDDNQLLFFGRNEIVRGYCYTLFDMQYWFDFDNSSKITGNIHDKEEEK